MIFIAIICTGYTQYITEIKEIVHPKVKIVNIYSLSCRSKKYDCLSVFLVYTIINIKLAQCLVVAQEKAFIE